MDCFTSKDPSILIKFLGDLENIFSNAGYFFLERNHILKIRYDRIKKCCVRSVIECICSPIMTFRLFQRDAVLFSKYLHVK